MSDPSEQPTGRHNPIPYEDPYPDEETRRDWGAIIERKLGKLTIALLKFSLVVFVFGCVVIVLIALARLLIPK